MHSSNALSVRNCLGGRDSVARMVTRIWSGRSGVRPWIAERRSERAWDSPSLLFHEYGGSLSCKEAGTWILSFNFIYCEDSEYVELRLHSPSTPPWHGQGQPHFLFRILVRYRVVQWASWKLKHTCEIILTLILLTWRIWWAPNNARKLQMGFNSEFKGLR
jgi:hypothetical protein